MQAALKVFLKVFMQTKNYSLAPAWHIAHWLNTSSPITLESLRGTPSLVLIDRQGHLRLSHFGHPDDLAVGSAIGQLLAETAGEVTNTVSPPPRIPP